MKNVFFALAIAAVAVSCTSTSEEAAVETTVDTTVVAEDTVITEEDVMEVEAAEASAE
jgi:hypothetical protein